MLKRVFLVCMSLILASIGFGETFPVRGFMYTNDAGETKAFAMAESFRGEGVGKMTFYEIELQQ